jgi:hypothetical protein
MTKAQLLSDIELALNQLNISDDSNIEWDQLAFWATTELNSLVAQECNAIVKAGKQIPPVYKKTALAEVAEIEDNWEDDKLYIEMEDQILDLNDDAGLILVETEDGDEVPKTSVERMKQLGKMRFAKPSISRPLHYRVGNKIYILGLTETDIPFEHLNFYYVPKQDLLAADDDYEVMISDQTRSALIQVLTEVGKLALYGTQIDAENNGEDSKQPVYHRQIQNPEQPQA